MIRWVEVLGILGGGEVGFCEDFPVFGGFFGLILAVEGGWRTAGCWVRFGEEFREISRVFPVLVCSETKRRSFWISRWNWGGFLLSLRLGECKEEVRPLGQSRGVLLVCSDGSPSIRPAGPLAATNGSERTWQVHGQRSVHAGLG